MLLITPLKIPTRIDRRVITNSNIPEVNGVNYSLALAQFILSFKKANDIITADSGLETFIIQRKEDPKDTLEYMKLFQEYLEIGKKYPEELGGESFSNWSTQSKALRILGFKSEILKKEIASIVKNTHFEQTPAVEEMIFTVDKSSSNLKDRMSIHAKNRGFGIF